VKFISKIFGTKKPEVPEQKPLPEPEARRRVSLEPGSIVRFLYDEKAAWSYEVYLGEDLWLAPDGSTFTSWQENVEAAASRGFWDDGGISDWTTRIELVE